jgi:hypothetical protein
MTDEPRPAPLLPPPPPGRAPQPLPPEPPSGAAQALRPEPAVSPVTAGGHGNRPRSSRGWRTTVSVAAVILVVVIGVNVADAAIPLPDHPAAIDGSVVPDASFPADPETPGAPEATLTPFDRGPVEQGAQLDVGLGYTIRPPAGWTVVSQEDDVTVLQKGAAVLVMEAIASEETPEDLAQRYRDAWFEDGSYTGGDPESRTVGDAIPAAQLDYTGAFEGTAVDGRIVTATADGAGLLVNLFTPAGALTEAAPDLERILASVRQDGA